MKAKVNFVSILFATSLATVWFFARMSAYMGLQMSLLGVRRTAKFTPEWFFSSVQAHVRIKNCRIGKTFATRCTTERPFSRVMTFVHLEMRAAPEGSFAKFARIGFRISVTLHVNRQVVLARVIFLANFADKSGNTVAFNNWFYVLI